METPRSREALEKLCEFLLREAGHSEVSDTLEDLFATAPQKAFRKVDVEVAFLVSPVAHRVPLYYIVPHEIHQGSICIVTPPPQRRYKDEVLKLSEDGDAIFQRVKRVIDSNKLSVKFTHPVTVRALAKSFDNFFVYGVKKYPPQLTGEFCGHQRHPIWVPRRSPFAERIREAAKTVVVPRRGHNSVTCCIGHTGLSIEKLDENLRSFLTQLTNDPQGVTHENILRIRVMGMDYKNRCAGLPIFCHTFQIPRTLPEGEEEGRQTKKRKKE
ncbi:Ribosomal protein L1p/L10e family, putative [Trypanosoma equiperdum]|uniref:Ribosomal protein L1p/L10e family n=4 Tax=Trypanozoon TaxID=39700 RepID=Q38AE4_TRYB2|nr:hypothetical protein, conserved [Trypanosoma brucei gambiense DAL972]XP_823054.1 hypothetical protein, conserved [Trypanosoma brucei brucei TREU927]RHW69422.1 Ribosomal protein L1p/L10e family [Trypanosoma brucei equiperdum]SCU70104.1 Ribosomal protein L1p/L10e family, putative [Trypanosoma equiperdum]EAN78226.1 hypothetical protein, conserved [Trypanosoma brucei brucei TREU927]CBH15911.1 hypothetical protein, conserved [Trypanosoma brucei gambiense DAL972]|eukprot:XP_011778175.1 hypothetical protein, conserved [Trypanosoma brucei gambiense DAL972]